MLAKMRVLTWVVVAFNALLAIAVVTRVPLSGRNWFLGNLVLAVVWFASQPRRQSCPNCNSVVPRTFLVCTVCRHDLAPLPPRRNRSTEHSSREAA
jgi:hypothetical protein